MPRHASENYVRTAAGLGASPPPPGGGSRLATETYADGVFGAGLTGSSDRIATEDYVAQLVINPPPPESFVDNFTRNDFPNLGGEWQGMAAGQFEILGARAAPGVDTFCVSIRDIEELSGDHRATVRIGTLGEVGGPIVRAPDVLGMDLGTTGGFYILTVSGAAHDVIAIRKHVPNAVVIEQLGVLVTNTPVAVGDQLRLEAEGSTLRGYLNGILIITRTDASISGDTNIRTGMYANQGLTTRFSRFESANGITPPPPITAPGAPTGATFALVTGATGAADASWAAPTATGGAAILGYQIRLTPSGRLITVGNILTTEVGGLTAGTSYTFTVSARNSVGYGAASAVSNAVTPANNPPPPPPPGTTVFRTGNWWERPLPANAPAHPSNRTFLNEFNTAGGPVNAQGDRYVGLTGGASAGAPNIYDTPIYRVSSGTSYILTKLSGAYFVAPEFLAGGAGLRIPEVAKQHFLLGGSQNSDAPMLVIDSARGYYANLAKTLWNDNLGRWEVGSVGGASIYYTSSYGHGGAHPGWPAALVQYDDDSRNGGFRGNNPMTRVIDYNRMVAQSGIPYVTELFAVRTGESVVFPLTGFESGKGGIVGEGVRLRLKPSLTDAVINSRLAATLSGNRLTQAVMIAKAWRDYGVVVGDNSGSGSRVKLENFSRRNVTNTWDVDTDDLKTFDFNPDSGDWVFVADEYFPPVSGGGDTTPPAVPATPSVNATSTSATVTWARVVDPDPVSYKVWKDNVLVNTTTTLSYVDSSVTAAATYVYKVSALDPSSNESAKSLGATVTIPGGGGDITAPTVPTGLTATAASTTQINLAWNPSTDAVGVTQYRVKRAGVVIATVTTTSYQNTGLTAGSTYSYSVAALDAAGNTSAYSTSVNGTTESGGTGNAPGVPPNVTATQTSDTMVTVKWGGSTGTVAAQKYKIYRSGPGGGVATIFVGERVQVSNTGFNKILTATGLAASTVFSFAVSAVSATGAESAKSATQNATTAAPKASPIGNVQVCYLSGDIAIGGVYRPNCIATGKIINNATDKDFVITLGDNAYSTGTIANFNDNYNPSWGGFKAITYPSVGNHDTPTAYSGYKAYFGTRVPSTYPSMYSYVKGNWLFLALDSCVPRGSADMTKQINWIQTTIAGRASTIKGICAYWHHARYTSTSDPDDLTMVEVITKLYEHNVDVVLQGHDHHYERFPKLNASGAPSATGMRFFVVGTGGSGRRPVAEPNATGYDNNSEQIIGGDMRGVLQMTFGDNGYSWRWKGCPDAIYADGGTSTATKLNPSTGDDSGFNAVNPR